MSDGIAWWQAVLLGAVQGVTEFLPISSDGHLALADALLRVPGGGVAFAVLLHVGTLLAVVFAFPSGLARLVKGSLGLPGALRRPPAAWDDATAFAGKVAVSAVPGAVCGLLFRDRVDASYEQLGVVGAGLLFTAAMLAATVRARGGERDVGYRDAALIGLFQALALLPGVSRSGMTISVALLLGVSRERAAEFSFVASAPLILGAAVLEGSRLLVIGGFEPLPAGVGIVSSFVVGWMALAGLLRIVRAGRFHRFAPYCAAVGLLSIAAALRH